MAHQVLNSTLATELMGDLKGVEYWKDNDGRTTLVFLYKDKAQVIVKPNPDGMRFDFGVNRGSQ